MSISPELMPLVILLHLKAVGFDYAEGDLGDSVSGVVHLFRRGLPSSKTTRSDDRRIMSEQSEQLGRARHTGEEEGKVAVLVLKRRRMHSAVIPLTRLHLAI